MAAIIVDDKSVNALLVRLTRHLHSRPAHGGKASVTALKISAGLANLRIGYDNSPGCVRRWNRTARTLIKLRKAIPVIVYGSDDQILPEHAQIYAFTRTLEEKRLIILLNFSQEPVVFTLPGDFAYTVASLLIGNYPVHPAEDIRSFILQPYEARVYRVTGHAQ